MRPLVALMTSLLLAPLVVAPTAADPAAQFGWGLGFHACVVGGTDVGLVPGNSVRVDVAVQDLVEPVQAYRAVFSLVAQDGGPLPDAWRFDSGGCHGGGSWHTDYLPPPVETGCTSLAFSSPIASGTTSLTLDPELRRLRADIVVVLSGIATPRADWAHLLASTAFEHFESVNGASIPEACGGLERALCVQLESVSFQRGDGGWFEVARPVPVLTVNAASLGGVAACASVPARPATWGAVRAGYR